MPDLCPKNHDKAVVGVTKWRRCRQCERERLRKAAQNRRTRPQPKIRYPKTGRRVAPVTDGLEAEYGPVPALVPNKDWFDEVIVVRALAKRPTGRRPYPLEWAEIIRRMPRTELTDEQVAEVTGVTTNYLDKLRRSQ
jgi:hypothetical protein